MPSEIHKPANSYSESSFEVSPVSEVLEERLELRAFGQTLTIKAPQIDFLRKDTLWRLQHIYQPALTTQTLPTTGVALDIGAGFGGFALPFAMAYPKWHIFCFEPDPIAFKYLLKNISDLSLTQITALPFAVGSQKNHFPKDPTIVRLAIEKLNAGIEETGEELARLLPLVSFSKSKINLGYLEHGNNATAEFEPVQLPTLAADFLNILNPTLLKLMAPKGEADILSDLSVSRIYHVIGESWGHIPSARIHGAAAVDRQIWVPRAGQPKLALRSAAVPEGRQSRLDVVYALSNDGNDLSCLMALLEDPSDEIRILAVGNASEAIQTFAMSDRRISIVATASQSLSAAWNFGRIKSNATHLAFLDGKSFAERGFFSRLFDLARQTGAEVVQGPYRVTGICNLFFYNPMQFPKLEFADTTYQRLDAPSLMAAPPSVSRRVYRRDFLDNRSIFFPEDEGLDATYVFQTLSLNQLLDVPELSGVNVIQQAPPPGQAFSTLGAFKVLFERAKIEGWFDLYPLLQSFAAQANRIAANLSEQDRFSFIQSAEEITASMEDFIATSTDQ